ncbi:MAG TPA: hypothetical protein VGR96_04395 [Acidobacteriaceae bacterium]|nr:hypothetical protein [Acidobacteriaceae bacterium]
MSIAQRRVGTDEREPERKTLRAGKIEADFCAGGMQAIRYEGREVLRAINYVVRDKDWGTDNPEILDCQIRQDGTGFTVTFHGRCARPETGEVLDYDARIEGDASGRIVFEAVAEPRTPFLTARCSFVVLHPILGVAGQPAIVEHVDGSEENATFPELIAPWQPFQNIRAIRHQAAPGISVSCRMTGDVFETEDQRNWSDASYKTYGRPLALPWPYVMEAGGRSRQSVELIIADHRQTPMISASQEETKEAPIGVEIGEVAGIFPRIGILIHPAQAAAVLAHPEMIAKLLPQLMLLHFDPTAGHGKEDLLRFAELVREYAGRAEYVLELVLPARRSVEDELQETARWIADAGLKLSGVMVSPDADRQSTLPGSHWPACPPLSEIYRAARKAFPKLALGGGMLSYFTELNRKRPPVDLLDFVSHCTCPIVHAADDRSVMQTLETMPYLVRSARAIVGEEIPYRIGPSTIGMRQNPYGSRVMDNPARRRMTMTDQDPRQTALFAAAWMIGYAASTMEGRLDALTVGAMTGALGLALPDGADKTVYHPAFHAARGLAELAGRSRYRCVSSRPDALLAVAGQDREGNRIAWLANLTDRNQRVKFAGGPGIGSVEILDENNFHEPALLNLKTQTTEDPPVLELRPYSVARVRLNSGK